MKNNLKTIVCLGDSITCNWNEKTYTDYWQELIDQEKHNYQIVNSGINAETAQDGYYRLDRDVLSHNPDLVTIMFGHNDLFWGFTPERFVEYVALIVNQLKNHQINNIWLLTPNKVGFEKYFSHYQPFIKALKNKAEEKKIKFVDIWNSIPITKLDSIYTLNSTWSETGTDYIHPNQKGHKLIAKILNKELNKHK